MALSQAMTPDDPLAVARPHRDVTIVSRCPPGIVFHEAMARSEDTMFKSMQQSRAELHSMTSKSPTNIDNRPAKQLKAASDQEYFHIVFAGM